MIIRRLVALAATAAGLLAGTGTGAASAVTSPGPFLDACSVLRAETSNDRLVNGAYELSVGSGIVSLRQSIPMSGSRGRDSFSTTTWFRDDPSGATQALPHDRSSLALYCNGDLALRSAAGRLLWHTNTANRGVVRLALTSTGTLLLQNRAGGIVWHSGSGSVGMPANSLLRSNTRLVNRAGEQYGDPVQTLAMQTDGNLVYRRGSRVVWQSGTRVPGSYAALTTKAQLLVLAPGGRVLYVAGRTGTSYSVLMVFNGELRVDQFTPSYTTLWRVG